MFRHASIPGISNCRIFRSLHLRVMVPDGLASLWEQGEERPRELPHKRPQATSGSLQTERTSCLWQGRRGTNDGNLNFTHTHSQSQSESRACRRAGSSNSLTQKERSRGEQSCDGLPEYQVHHTLMQLMLVTLLMSLPLTCPPLFSLIPTLQ